MDDTRRELEELLARPVQAAEDAERAARAAEALASYIRATEDARRVLSGTRAEAQTEQAAGPLADKSLHDAAELVLDRAKVPLHARELAKRIKAGGWRHKRSKNARGDQIVYQLAARLPRYPDRFRRVAPNTFALTKWGDAARSGARRPRTGLFRGPGGHTARGIGDRPELVSEATAWR